MAQFPKVTQLRFKSRPQRGHTLSHAMTLKSTLLWEVFPDWVLVVSQATSITVPIPIGLVSGGGLPWCDSWLHSWIAGGNG